ncbi:MAG: histidine phosphatase family protein [Actinomycetota bacterium]|uniref:Histidine phosphatase family protein n=1 Tax=Mycobacterium lentiflavum TaxID=141349 RepID=A0ABY3UXS6_MYCLN|nr:histidine phosphatase family protein [Mycobacterium lentiflavum]MEE3062943.1 histidine phosphatase family protein [Actinomycetota bacterium]ULP42079.1 histidine phosphatase family protein [Mycobacterium lentiflavum]
MTEVVRLAMVSHAMTDAMAAVRFPADEPLSDIGRRQAEAAAGLDIRGARQLAGPEMRVRQTAQLLGLDATTEPRLADLDCGIWRGQTLEGVPAADREAWLSDPAASPHGGESIVDLIDRVGGWLDSLANNTLRVVAVTHPAIIRAAIVITLGVAPTSFWRIDIAPLSCIAINFRENRWTLRM